ncbi:MAG: hypothetical protein BAJATHORv1_40360 [Candidatus Thorarchaeota archaeon]|nr:MAG: hypothetical protein BAJATHORv1_40360 [Candidatus Thorarchaeota archaeon]
MQNETSNISKGSAIDSRILGLPPQFIYVGILFGLIMGYNFVVDPVHGRIQIPKWVKKLVRNPEIRRMYDIRQLGLKAYTGFPGAMHTRYIHCIGTMHLAKILVDKLKSKEDTHPRPELRENLNRVDNVLMAAGFFHDVGHGPFSHVLDFVTDKMMGKKHEHLAVEILEKYEREIENAMIPFDMLTGIFSRKSSENKPYQYISEIIDGPLDVDKMDYLLRDSYHTGLKYGFDLEYLMDHIDILGNGENLEKYQIGLKDSPNSIVVAENFLLIWRSMYSLVYYYQPTRIAEKMLEKAVIVAIEEDSEFMKKFTNVDEFLKLGETSLLNDLLSTGEESKELVDLILSENLYIPVYEKKFGEEFEKSNLPFFDAVKDNSDSVSDEISRKMSEKFDSYSVIFDIIKNKVPKTIRINKIGEEGEPIELTQVSPIVKAMSKQEMKIYVYIKPKLADESIFKKENIDKQVSEIIREW